MCWPGGGCRGLQSGRRWGLRRSRFTARWAVILVEELEVFGILGCVFGLGLVVGIWLGVMVDRWK